MTAIQHAAVHLPTTEETGAAIFKERKAGEEESMRSESVAGLPDKQSQQRATWRALGFKKNKLKE